MNCHIENISATLTKRNNVNARLSKRNVITAQLLKADKIVTHELPENYGLITWNGKYILVS